MTQIAASQITGAKYWIDASTVGANWETTGFDDSSWTTCPDPEGNLVYLYNATALGLGSNIGAVGGSDSDAANVFVRFYVPGCVTLRLIGNIDDWIHTIYVNGTSVYTETTQTTHDFDVTVTTNLLARSSNLVAMRTVNSGIANAYSFGVQTPSTYEGAGWTVGAVTLS